MLHIADGIVIDARVRQRLISNIDVGPLDHVNAIVVHQTGSKTADGTMSGYSDPKRPDGAHFLIDKSGHSGAPERKTGEYLGATIYQNVPINRKCQHVGRIYSKCFQIHNCTKTEIELYESMYKRGYGSGTRAIDRVEQTTKNYPNRYPTNSDSIGIEIVSLYLGDENNPTHAYEPPTDPQQQSLKWLIEGLLAALKLTRQDIYRHAQISNKKEGEGPRC